MQPWAWLISRSDPKRRRRTTCTWNSCEPWRFRHCGFGFTAPRVWTSLGWPREGSTPTLMLSNLPWDVSGGILLVREAGGVVFDRDGAEHEPRSEYTLASTAGLRDSLVQLVSRATATAAGAGRV
jgi:Inositol monophosphatase family